MIKKFLLLTFCILSYSYENSRASITDCSNSLQATTRYPLQVYSLSERDSKYSLRVSSTFKLNFEHNSINKFDNIKKISTRVCKTNILNACTKNSRANKKLQKYKPLYKIIYKLQLMTTIRFKSLLIIFIFLRTISSLYNNINDIVSIINLIDEKDIKDIKKVLELLSFINFINIFNIVTFFELYDIIEHIELINKKLLLYKKYVRLYKKDCFMINYI